MIKYQYYKTFSLLHVLTLYVIDITNYTLLYFNITINIVLELYF
jgi:hypothetical protein